MKKKILIIEPLSYKKHKNLVTSIINENIKNNYEVDLIASASFSENLSTIYTLKDECVVYNNKIEFVLKQILILLKIRKYFTNNYTRIIFTSYENYSMALCAVLFSTDFELLVNNNFKKSRIAKLLNKKIFSSNTPIFFEKSFKNYLNSKKYNLQKHPLGKISVRQKSMINRNYILCHFTNIPSKTELIYLEELAKNKKCYLLTNSKYCKTDKRFTYNSFFKNYYQTINDAELLYLSVDYEYRISGVFYDYIGFQKEIIVNSKSEFYSNLLKEYLYMKNLTCFSKL